MHAFPGSALASALAAASSPLRAGVLALLFGFAVGVGADDDGSVFLHIELRVDGAQAAGADTEGDPKPRSAFSGVRLRTEPPPSKAGGAVAAVKKCSDAAPCPEGGDAPAPKAPTAGGAAKPAVPGSAASGKKKPVAAKPVPGKKAGAQTAKKPKSPPPAKRAKTELGFVQDQEQKGSHNAIDAMGRVAAVPDKIAPEVGLKPVDESDLDLRPLEEEASQ